MRLVWKCIKWLLLTVLVLAVLAVGAVGVKGYMDFRDALAQTSVTEMAASIRAQEHYTAIEQIPRTYVQAVIAVEDSRFEYHHGVDPIALIRALRADIKSRSLEQGGSTITQQLAKNVYFSADQTLLRKVAEAFMALEIERNFSKDEIFALYVNSIYYGSGYYCLYDASMGYFGVTPSELSDYQATLLAGIPNAPSVYSLDVNPDLARERQWQVLSAMVSCGDLSQEEARQIYDAP